MKPVKFKGMTTNYVADGCGDLPAMVEVGEDPNGGPVITSVWKPSEEDLKILNEGGCVCLSLYGCQPPVGMWVQKVDTIVEDGNQ